MTSNTPKNTPSDSTETSGWIDSGLGKAKEWYEKGEQDMLERLDSLKLSISGVWNEGKDKIQLFQSDIDNSIEENKDATKSYYLKQKEYMVTHYQKLLAELESWYESARDSLEYKTEKGKQKIEDTYKQSKKYIEDIYKKGNAKLDSLLNRF